MNRAVCSVSSSCEAPVKIFLFLWKDAEIPSQVWFTGVTVTRLSLLKLVIISLTLECITPPPPLKQLISYKRSLFFLPFFSFFISFVRTFWIKSWFWSCDFVEMFRLQILSKFKCRWVFCFVFFFLTVKTYKVINVLIKLGRFKNSEKVTQIEIPAHVHQGTFNLKIFIIWR